MKRPFTNTAARLFGVGLAAVLIVGLLSPTVAQDGSITRPPTLGSGDQRDARPQRQRKRLREGTRITDRLGHFEPTGDGAMFIGESGGSFGVLPNLNLERVVRMLRSFDQPANVRWSVSGLITEYTGRNYLLLSKAIYKANTDALLDDPKPQASSDER